MRTIIIHVKIIDSYLYIQTFFDETPIATKIASVVLVSICKTFCCDLPYSPNLTNTYVFRSRVSGVLPSVSKSQGNSRVTLDLSRHTWVCVCKDEVNPILIVPLVR